MTLIPFINGKILFRGGNVGSGQSCCCGDKCNPTYCYSGNECNPPCTCVDGICVPPCDPTDCPNGDECQPPCECINGICRPPCNCGDCVFNGDLCDTGWVYEITTPESSGVFTVCLPGEHVRRVRKTTEEAALPLHVEGAEAGFAYSPKEGSDAIGFCGCGIVFILETAIAAEAVGVRYAEGFPKPGMSICTGLIYDDWTLTKQRLRAYVLDCTGVPTLKDATADCIDLWYDGQPYNGGNIETAAGVSTGAKFPPAAPEGGQPAFADFCDSTPSLDCPP